MSVIYKKTSAECQLRHHLVYVKNVNFQGLRDWRMETPLTAEAGENGAAAAGNSNLLPFDSNRPEGTVSSSSHITVFTVLVIWTLLALTLTSQWVILLSSNRVAMYTHAIIISVPYSIESQPTKTC